MYGQENLLHILPGFIKLSGLLGTVWQLRPSNPFKPSIALLFFWFWSSVNTLFYLTVTVEDWHWDAHVHRFCLLAELFAVTLYVRHWVKPVSISHGMLGLGLVASLNVAFRITAHESLANAVYYASHLWMWLLMLHSLSIYMRKHPSNYLPMLMAAGISLSVTCASMIYVYLVDEYPQTSLGIMQWSMAALLLVTEVLVYAHAMEQLTAVQKHHQESQRLAALHEDLIRIQDEKAHMVRALTVSTKARNMGDLVSTLTHELRQPLGVLRLNSEHLLYAHQVTEQERLSILESIVRETERSERIINRLKSFFESQSIARESVDWVQLVKQVESIFMPQAIRQGVSISLSAPASVRIQGDRSQLQMVVLNLFKNALDALKVHSSGLGRICVEISVSSSSVRMDLTDNGPGLSPQQLDKVFDMYVSSKLGGMGLGLWLSRSIVDEHGGQLLALPSSVGAHFCCILPLHLSSSNPDIESAA